MAKTPQRRPMSTAPAKRATTSVVTPPTPETPADPAEVVEGTAGEPITEDELKKEPEVSDEMVTAIVPKDFMLTLQHGVEVRYKAGVQEMPKSHAAHWFARSVGVKEYQG